MTFGELILEVYRILGDPQQAVWPNSVVARHASDAARRIANRLNLAAARTDALGLVAGQQEYTLPAYVRRVTEVRLLSESGLGVSPPLTQVDANIIPFVDPGQKDPVAYSLLSGKGANENQISLFMWPSPLRTTPNAIIVDYETDFTFESDDPATTTQKDDQNIPFPNALHTPLLYYICSGLLLEMNDDMDVQRGIQFMQIADRMASDNQHFNSVQYYRDIRRPFP